MTQSPAGPPPAGAGTGLAAANGVGPGTESTGNGVLPAVVPAPRRGQVRVGSTGEAAAGPRRFPWIIIVLSIVFFAGLFPRQWVYAWTVDPSPSWAQPAVLLLGLLALLSLVHALVGVQLRAAEVGEDPASGLTSRAVIERAVGATGFGVFAGTLLALFSADAAPAGVTISSLLSDLATVGGVAGLALLIPHHAVVTYQALRALRRERPGGWFKAHATLAVIDAILIYKLAALLPALLAPFR